MRPIDLSHTILPGMPQWRGDVQPLAIHRVSMHGESSHMSSSLEFGCHIGTHVDAPLHFLDGAPGVDEMPLEAFGGAALVLDATAAVGADGKPVPLDVPLLEGVNLAGIEFLLIRTGWDTHWGTESYYEDWPALTQALAEQLAVAGLRGVGVDTPSPDPYGGQVAHELFAAKNMINIENLTGLDQLPERGAWFQAFPLKLQATEASPVRAIAWVEPA